MTINDFLQQQVLATSTHQSSSSSLTPCIQHEKTVKHTLKTFISSSWHCNRWFLLAPSWRLETMRRPHTSHSIKS